MYLYIYISISFYVSIYISIYIYSLARERGCVPRGGAGGGDNARSNPWHMRQPKWRISSPAFQSVHTGGTATPWCSTPPGRVFEAHRLLYHSA